MENRGEGIFIQIKREAIEAWLKKTAVQQRGRLLLDGFELWRDDHRDSNIDFPGLPYYMLHSLSHLLLTAISLECGYPGSSLRERIYATAGAYGILIHTGSSDAEGTLCGLVLTARESGGTLPGRSNRAGFVPMIQFAPFRFRPSRDISHCLEALVTDACWSLRPPASNATTFLIVPSWFPR
jgi:hypothetical protein